MEEKSRTTTSLGIGTTSILMVFVILILVTFSILSLSGAKTDQKLGNMTLKRTQDYYEAENQAEKKLAEIDQKLYFAKGQMDFVNTLSDIDGIIILEEKKQVSYKEIMSDKQYLDVLIQLQWNDGKQIYQYKKIRWQTVVTGEWTVEDDIPVYQP